MPRKFVAKRKREEPNVQERESELRRASSLLPAAKAKQIATFPAPFMDYMKESGLATNKEMLNLLSTSHKESASRDYFIKAHTKLNLNALDDEKAERFVSMYKPFEKVYRAKSIEEIGSKRAQMATELILDLDVRKKNDWSIPKPIVINELITWPKDLKKIAIVSQITNIDISLAKWPNTLQSLVLIADTTTANNLPDSIVELHLKLRDKKYKSRKLSDYNISPRLQSLVIQWPPEDFFEGFKWPETLKSLAIHNFLSPLRLLDLPDSLETLYIEGFLFVPRNSIFLKWPKNLLNLKLVNVGEGISDLKTLPSSLKILWWKAEYLLPNFEDLSHLPNLEIFVFDVMYENQRLDIKEPKFKIYVNSKFKMSQTTLSSKFFNFLTKESKNLFPKVMTEADRHFDVVWYYNYF